MEGDGAGGARAPEPENAAASARDAVTVRAPVAHERRAALPPDATRGVCRKVRRGGAVPDAAAIVEVHPVPALQAPFAAAAGVKGAAAAVAVGAPAAVRNVGPVLRCATGRGGHPAHERCEAPPPPELEPGARHVRWARRDANTVQ